MQTGRNDWAASEPVTDTLTAGLNRLFKPKHSSTETTVLRQSQALSSAPDTHLADCADPDLRFGHVLQLDVTGVPQAWIGVELAAAHMAARAVAWTVGDGPLAVLRGGTNARTGRRSELVVPPILALHGAARINLFDCVPAYGKAKVFRRDRHTCAYCGQVFRERDLTVDHIVPESHGGPLSWMNTVAACRGCNGMKAARTPEQARMPLLFAPYVPSRFEDFLLRGRHIRADVHAWLAARLPKGSRLQ